MIEVKNLTKIYGEFKAVINNEISGTVVRDDVVELIEAINTIILE